jgi:hypothetical protein
MVLLARYSVQIVIVSIARNVRVVMVSIVVALTKVGEWVVHVNQCLVEIGPVQAVELLLLSFLLNHVIPALCFVAHVFKLNELLKVKFSAKSLPQGRFFSLEK